MKVTRELFSVLLEETKEKIILDMAQQGVPKEMQDAIIPSTSNHTELMVFDQLDSAYKRKEFFLKHFNLVVSKSPLTRHKYTTIQPHKYTNIQPHKYKQPFNHTCRNAKK